jgi:hypothetical protein
MGAFSAPIEGEANPGKTGSPDSCSSFQSACRTQRMISGRVGFLPYIRIPTR